MALPALLGAFAGTASRAAVAAKTAGPFGFGGPATPGSPAVAATGMQALIEKAKPLADGIGKVQDQFGKLTGAAGKVASAAGLITEPMKAVVGVMGAFRDSITALGNQVSQFTRLANPALTQRFQFAAEDLTAVIGKMLLPVLEFATKFTRMFADSLNQIAGPVQRLIATALKPLNELMPVLTNTIGPVLRGMGMMIDVLAAVVRPMMVVGAALLKVVALPLEIVFSALAAALEILLTPLNVMLRIWNELADAIGGFISRATAWVRNLLGLKSAAGSSEGAAFRSVSMGSTESFQSKAWTAAMGMGTASADERTATIADQIYAWLKTLPEKMWEKIKELPSMIARAIASGATDLAEGAWDMLPDRPEWAGGSAKSAVGSATSAESRLTDMFSEIARRRAELVAATARGG